MLTQEVLHRDLKRRIDFMGRFFSKRLSGLLPYVPGEQPQDMQYIKLNTNESPFPPSPKVVEAIAGESGKLNLYSDPECKVLNDAIAKALGVEKDMVISGNGSDEVLAFCYMAFCDDDTGVCYPDIYLTDFILYSKMFSILTAKQFRSQMISKSTLMTI